MARTEDQILDEIHALDEQMAALRGRKQACWQEIDRARAQAKLTNMPDAEREALLQVIQADGIPTAEKVG